MNVPFFSGSIMSAPASNATPATSKRFFRLVTLFVAAAIDIAMDARLRVRS